MSQTKGKGKSQNYGKKRNRGPTDFELESEDDNTSAKNKTNSTTKRKDKKDRKRSERPSRKSREPVRFHGLKIPGSYDVHKKKKRKKNELRESSKATKKKNTDTVGKFSHNYKPQVWNNLTTAEEEKSEESDESKMDYQFNSSDDEPLSAKLKKLKRTGSSQEDVLTISSESSSSTKLFKSKVKSSEKKETRKSKKSFRSTPSKLHQKKEKTSSISLASSMRKTKNTNKDVSSSTSKPKAPNRVEIDLLSSSDGDNSVADDKHEKTLEKKSQMSETIKEYSTILQKFLDGTKDEYFPREILDQIENRLRVRAPEFKIKVWTSKSSSHDKNSNNLKDTDTGNPSITITLKCPVSLAERGKGEILAWKANKEIWHNMHELQNAHLRKIAVDVTVNVSSKHKQLGMYLRDVNGYYANQGNPVDGVYIQSFMGHSPLPVSLCAAAEKGAMLLSINSSPVTSTEHVIAILKDCKENGKDLDLGIRVPKPSFYLAETYKC